MDDYQRNELHGLKDLVVRLVDVTEGGLQGAVLDLGPENLAKMRIKLMNKDYSQFDKLFMAVCSDFSSEIICLTEEAGKFPDHKFVLFENILHGKKREELHYILGSSADSVEKY
ncbi:hypothetical protein HOM13_01775 [Candidatus Woesearchaeota archaeon]|nr:hypothetical protein [Candidatus Woesearchaeota archaeon]